MFRLAAPDKLPIGIRRFPPGELLVVLDLKLGRADGVDVLKEIRGKYPTKPVAPVAAASSGRCWGNPLQ